MKYLHQVYMVNSEVSKLHRSILILIAHLEVLVRYLMCFGPLDTSPQADVFCFSLDMIKNHVQAILLHSFGKKHDIAVL